jgi:hypothetical protein
MFTAALAGVLVSIAAADPIPPVPNGDFHQGGAAPTGWTLSGGQGRWLDRKLVEVTGSGKDTSEWRCEYPFVAGGLYRFEYRARGTIRGGCGVAGPCFANRDFQPTPEWKSYGFVFRAPDVIRGSYLRLGQWEAAGTIQFDSVRLTAVVPVYMEVGDVMLGEGESVRGGHYCFSGTFGGAGSNFHRTLHSATASFNSDRWCFGGGDEVVYRFRMAGPNRPIYFFNTDGGRLGFNINYHTRGACIAEMSGDGKEWRPLTAAGRPGSIEAKVPPVDETLYIRLRSTPDGDFQVSQINLDTWLCTIAGDGAGRTLFANLEASCPSLSLREISLSAPLTSGHYRLANTGTQTVDADCHVVAVGGKLATGGLGQDGWSEMEGDSALHSRMTRWHGWGFSSPPEETVVLFGDRKEQSRGRARLTITVPDFYRTDYGRLLAAVSADSGEKARGDRRAARVWWCDPGHKIPVGRGCPESTSGAACFSAARNGNGQVQIAVRTSSRSWLNNLTATAGPLNGVGGTAIPAENVGIHRVGSHFVEHPTDSTGIADFWPDALPPLSGPISEEISEGTNQPLWVVVYVPKDAKPGDYEGTVRLKAEDWSATVPLKLHVWDFALPDTNHLETAFGLDANTIWRYHRLKTEADKRRVFDMYLQNFAEHRISPQNPTPLDPIVVRLLPEAKPPRAEVDFTRFDREMERVIDTYHFTNFVLPVEGMGGGTFQFRAEPKIGRFGEDSPEYQAVFESYVKQLEQHLREKGWLKMAYLYWFDEPAAKDYAFVRRGMERVKRYAPGLQTMLTVAPHDQLSAVDIWCPLTPNYDPTVARRCEARGERFWWYVCCGPKAPYCTLFIDHPATELRVWLWQTWQRKVSGILVWSANYWTSDTAFPDRPQNPYEDPMGYVSDSSLPRGTKQYWGNGDGRFLYPPESAVAAHGGDGPILEPPVSSIRWEMLREGIEDYEFLCILRERIEKHRAKLRPEEIRQYEALLEVPPEITRDMTTFTTDPAPIQDRRAAIARAIERLGKEK